MSYDVRMHRSFSQPSRMKTRERSLYDDQSKISINNNNGNITIILCISFCWQVILQSYDI